VGLHGSGVASQNGPTAHNGHYLTAIPHGLTLLSAEKTCYAVKYRATHEIPDTKTVLIPVLALRQQAEPSTIVPLIHLETINSCRNYA